MLTRDEYQKIKQNGSEDEIIEFTKTIMNSKQPVPADYFARKRKIEEVKEKIGDEGWISWKKALTYEGEDVLLELVQSGALESRVHPKLPKGSKIAYPMNLQVYYVEEKSATPTQPKMKPHCKSQVQLMLKSTRVG